MHITRLALPVCCLIFNCVYVQAQDVKKIETFSEASMAEKVMPQYPERPRSRNEEGWVVVNFMVDPAGKPYEPTVLDSMGDKAFQEQVLKALKESKFHPATLSGKPVTSSSIMRYSFRLAPDLHGASGAFVRKYKWFINILNNGNQEKTEKALSGLDALGAKSLYEEAFLNLAKFNYAHKYGKPEAELEYLTRALYFDNKKTFETFLPKEMAQQLWPILFVMQVRNKLYAEALETFCIISNTGNDEAVKKLTPVTKQIESLRKNNAAYMIPGKTDDHGYWNITLFKHSFYLDKVQQSNIDEIKLRCNKKYQFFKYTAGIKYNVPDSFGACALEIIGDPNISFDFVQL